MISSSAAGLIQIASGTPCFKLKKYRVKIAAHSQSNPVLSGEFDMTAIQEVNRKNLEISKDFMKSTDVKQNNGNSMEALQENIAGIIKASLKHEEAGVEMMKY